MLISGSRALFGGASAPIVSAAASTKASSGALAAAARRRFATSRRAQADEAAQPAPGSAAAKAAAEGTAAAEATEPSASKSPLPLAFQRRISPDEESSKNETPGRRTPLNLSAGSPRGRLFNRGVLYELHVRTTRNNTILTLCTNLGVHSPSAANVTRKSGGADEDLEAQVPLFQPVAWVSAGSAGFKGANRSTYDAGVQCALLMLRRLTSINASNGQDRRLKLPKGGIPPAVGQLDVFFSGFGQGREAVFRTIMSGEGDDIRCVLPLLPVQVESS